MFIATLSEIISAPLGAPWIAHKHVAPTERERMAYKGYKHAAPNGAKTKQQGQS